MHLSFVLICVFFIGNTCLISSWVQINSSRRTITYQWESLDCASDRYLLPHLLTLSLPFLSLAHTRTLLLYFSLSLSLLCSLSFAVSLSFSDSLPRPPFLTPSLFPPKLPTLTHSLTHSSLKLHNRGLDFPDIDWVVQVDAPEDTNMYIHRVGRTAR